jgi:alpha-tubulin suppressor-like RCC1 family protein
MRPILLVAAVCGLPGLVLAQPVAGRLLRWGLDSSQNEPPSTWRFKEFSAGYKFSLAIVNNPTNDPNIPADGSIYGWGQELYPAEYHILDSIPTGNFTAVSAGFNIAMAIDTDSHLHVWGQSTEGNEFAGELPSGLEEISFRAIEAGESLAVALDVSGNLYFWGESEAFRASIVIPRGTAIEDQTFTEISAHGHHVMARQTEGEVVGWGPNLGNPGVYNRGQTANIPHPNDFQDFTAGHWHSGALQDGQWVGQFDPAGPVDPPTLLPWGWNDYDQCDPSALTDRPTSALVKVEGGYFHTTVVTQYGGLYAWGRSAGERLNTPAGRFKRVSSRFNHGLAEAVCYANCDMSTTSPVLSILDYNCFLNAYSEGDPSANCDGSTTPPVLSVNDYNCFVNAYTAGCP